MKEKLYNLGVIEVMDLSNLGIMSYNRANKIRKENYGGRPWRFPTMKEMGYIRSLRVNLGLGIFDQRYYWISGGYYDGSSLGYHMESGTPPSMIRNSSKACGTILIRDL